MDLEVLEKNNKVKLDMKFTFWFMYCFFFLFGAYDLKAQKNKLFDDRLFSKLLIQATGEKISGDLYSAASSVMFVGNDSSSPNPRGKTSS